LIKKIKIKDCKKFLKLFNNNEIDKIWLKIKQDFSSYEWEEAELQVNHHASMVIVFKNFRKKSHNQ
jgi:hypothetical protein